MLSLRCALLMFFHLSAYSMHLCHSGFYWRHHCSSYATISAFMTCYWVSSHSYPGNHMIASTTLPRVTRQDWKGHHAPKVDELRVQCQLSASSSVPYSSISCSHLPVTCGKGPLGRLCPTVPFIFLFHT